MYLLLVTAITSQLEMSPLKALAELNMKPMSVTAAVFQLEMSPLKRTALSNIKLMSVTAAVFHFEISTGGDPPLAYPKLRLSSNSLDIFVTWLTSQSLIGVPPVLGYRQPAPVGY